MLEGREGREKFGSRRGKKKGTGDAGTSNKVKAKKKNFMRVKHKLRHKAKRSFAEKARDLKQAMIKSRKFK